MKLRWIVMVVVALRAAFGTLASDPALARVKHRAKVVCDPRPLPPYTAHDFFWGRPAPTPNGCAPPVYEYGKYVGQDPDPNIRAQLRRDPRTGYDPF